MNREETAKKITLQAAMDLGDILLMSCVRCKGRAEYMARGEAFGDGPGSSPFPLCQSCAEDLAYAMAQGLSRWRKIGP